MTLDPPASLSQEDGEALMRLQRLWKEIWPDLKEDVEKALNEVPPEDV